jgi:hypothetical protein
MPSVDFMRSELKRLYPKSTVWARRVNRMKDGQIVAIYFKSTEKLAELDSKPKEDPPSEDDMPF